MQIKAFQVYEPVDIDKHPYEIQMLTRGIDVMEYKSKVAFGDWSIHLYDQDVFRFYNPYEMCRADRALLGNRRGPDLCNVYGPDSWAWNAFPEAYVERYRQQRGIPEPSGDEDAFEGRFNVSQAIYSSVYPITIFPEDGDFPIPQQFFVPVPALIDLLHQFDTYASLSVASGPAMVGDVMYQLTAALSNTSNKSLIHELTGEKDG